MPNPWPADVSRVATLRVTMLPGDSNARGRIFRGIILSQIDPAGAIAAARQASRNFVARAMRGVVFIASACVGDGVSSCAGVVCNGHTSIVVRVVVEAERNEAPRERIKVSEAEVVEVALDGQGKAILIK